MRHVLLILMSILFNQTFIFASVACKDIEKESVDKLKSCISITLTLAAGPGGGSDTVTREFGAQLNALGISNVIENIGAANGHIAATKVKNSKSNCQFLVTSNSNISLNALRKDLNPKIDPLVDFKPVSLLTTAPFVLAYRKPTRGTGFKETSELLDANRPAQFFGSAGMGGIGHIISSAFIKKLGLKDTHVPYTSSSQASLGLLQGEQISFLFESPTTILGAKLYKPNEIEILGTTGDKPIKVTAKDKEGNKKTDTFEPLNKNFPKLGAEFNFQPYIGILRNKDADPTYGDALEKLSSCILNPNTKDNTFNKKFTDRGYSIANGSADSLMKAMLAYQKDSPIAQLYQQVMTEEMSLDSKSEPTPSGATSESGRKN